jgi:hypothetical protein
MLSEVWKCARPTEGSHVLTTHNPAQRFKDAKRRPHQRGALAIVWVLYLLARRWL